MESKYGKITTEHKQIPEDEPLFLLRAQDVLAPVVVRFYADLYQGVHGGTSRGKNHAENLREWAEKMASWPHRKLPD